jgi:hypothetical protein
MYEFPSTVKVKSKVTANLFFYKPRSYMEGMEVQTYSFSKPAQHGNSQLKIRLRFTPGKLSPTPTLYPTPFHRIVG